MSQSNLSDTKLSNVEQQNIIDKNNLSPQQLMKRQKMDNQSSNHYLNLIDNESTANHNFSSFDVRAPNDGLSENLTASQIKSLKQQK